jgi:putative PIN family toxin of toxin-antitoxin system
MYRIVLDTNVIVAALRSRKGASFAILSAIGKSWRPVISAALILEYESIGKREASRLGIPELVVDAILDAFCAAGERTQIHFRLRPSITDTNDEFAIELAVAAAANAIVTHNVKDFIGADRYGIQVWTPHSFLEKIR